MIFKYRGTTIRLFSTKLFILVTLGVCAIFAVFTLHEMITFNPLNHSDSPPDESGGLDLNVAQTGSRLQEDVKTATVGSNAAANENINKNVPQERIATTLHPTVKISQNRSVMPEIAKLRDFVRSLNEKQYIRNVDKFGTEFSQSSIVIIIQVHDRVDYFSHLLKSLSRAKGIENAFLVISNDYYSEEINRHVESIDFCRVSEAISMTICRPEIFWLPNLIPTCTYSGTLY